MVTLVEVDKFLIEFLSLKNNLSANTGDWNFGDVNLITTGTAFLGLIDLGTNTIDDLGMTGAWNMNSGALTNVNIDSGTIDGITGTANFASLTASGTITAEQITSTDDITMQGHLFTLGDGSATDIVMSFSASANDGTITYDESADMFNFASSSIQTSGKLGVVGTVTSSQQVYLLGATGADGTTGGIATLGNSIRLEGGFGGRHDFGWDVGGGSTVTFGGPGAECRVKSGEGGGITALGTIISYSGSGGPLVFLSGNGGFVSFEAASAIAATGGSAGPFTFIGGTGGGWAGGNTTTGAFTSGAGGSFAFSGGNSSAANGSSVTNTSGSGGAFIMNAGNSGAVATNGATGTGGSWSINAGDSGAFSGTTGSSGNGGSITMSAGTSGSSTDTKGANGSITLKTAKNNVFKINEDGDTLIGDAGVTNYISITETGDQTFAGSAGFYPRVLNQSAEPAAGTGATQLDTAEMCIWTDTDDSKAYFCFNHGGTVKTVELV